MNPRFHTAGISPPIGARGMRAAIEGSTAGPIAPPSADVLTPAANHRYVMPVVREIAQPLDPQTFCTAW